MSPSRDARKMRRLRLRTVFSARRQSTSCQFRSSLVVFTRLSPRIERLPWFCNPCVASRAIHQTRVSTLSGRGCPQIEPPIRRVMVSPCLSAGGLRFSGPPVPAGVFRSPYGLPTARRRTPSGFRVPHDQRCGWGGCLLYAGARCPHGDFVKSPTDGPLSP